MEISNVSEQSERERASQTLAAAKEKTDSARKTLNELRSQLDAKKNLRARLQERYDSEAMQGDLPAAKETLGEMGTLSIEIDGLALSIQKAEEAVRSLEEAERPFKEEMRRLERAAAIEAERRKTEEMIGEAEHAYGGLNAACERFEKAILALKQYRFLDESHKQQTADAAFRITARVKGFNY